MSYDLLLFKPIPGEEPSITAQRDNEELPLLPPSDEKEALKRRIADSLIKHNPQLERFEFDFEAIARSQGIPVAEATRRFRHVELNGPEGSNGIQVTLFDDSASITVPYWHQGDAARATFREIWSYLQIIHDLTAWLGYDPQIDRVFKPSTGYDDALARYLEVAGKAIQILPEQNQAMKPWWKFW